MAAFPGDHLVRWCYNLPAGCGLYLAHLYLICTSGDVSPMFLEGDDIWREFQGKISKADIPVRMAVKLNSAMSTISFLLECLASADQRAAEAFPVPPGHAVVHGVANPIWQELLRSLEHLSARFCGPERLAAWLTLTLSEMDACGGQEE